MSGSPDDASGPGNIAAKRQARNNDSTEKRHRFRPRSSRIGSAPLVVTAVSGLIVLVSFVPWIDARSSLSGFLDRVSTIRANPTVALVAGTFLPAAAAISVSWWYLRRRARWSALRIAVLGVLLVTITLSDLDQLRATYGLVAAAVPALLMIAGIVTICGLERLPLPEQDPYPAAAAEAPPPPIHKPHSHAPMPPLEPVTGIRAPEHHHLYEGAKRE